MSYKCDKFICPKCGQSDKFYVTASAWFKLDQTQDTPQITYTEEVGNGIGTFDALDGMMCGACGHHRFVFQFDPKQTVTCHFPNN